MCKQHYRLFYLIISRFPQGCVFLIYFLTSGLIEKLLIVFIRQNFNLRSLVELDSELLNKGQMHWKMLGRNK